MAARLLSSPVSVLRAKMTVACFLLVGLLATGQAASSQRKKTRQPPAASAAQVQFVDVGQSAGLRFHHYSGASPEKYVIETMGSGAAFLDYDNDGWLDIFLVNVGEVPGHPAPGPVRHALYHNQGDGTFRETTAAAGVGGNGHYGMGVSAADYDGD